VNNPNLRDTLRLACVVAVVNGFTSLTGVAFGMYASMAVLSVTVGNYGNTIELGRQRLVGTAVGGVVVFFAYQAWGALPLMVALPLTLLLARLIAGSLRLTVGYSVCCFMVVMGWLQHEQQLGVWIHYRLFWTAFGILMALLSLRLFWPSLARQQQRQGLLQLLVDLGQTIEIGLGSLPPGERRRVVGQRLRQLKGELQDLRLQRQGALFELGALADQHPMAQLWELLDQASEALILELDTLRRQPDFPWQAWGLEAQHATAVDFAASIANRLRQWQGVLDGPLHLPCPPEGPRPELPVEWLHAHQSQEALQQLNAQQLSQVATRLIVLNKVEHTISYTERRWKELAR
jgi:hypothetical protein